MSDRVVVGMLAVATDDVSGWIELLYVDPEHVGDGIGSMLLRQAQADLGSPIRLYTFQASSHARAFYERKGFVAIAFGDGSTNEEGCPDVLYEWRD